MSFLFEDEVLGKLILDSKMLEPTLRSFAQQTKPSSLPSKELVSKLFDRLNTQLISVVSPQGLPGGETGQTITGQMFFEDLQSLDTFVSYLYKNVAKFNGKTIVIKKTDGLTSDNYVEYEDKYIDINGLQHVLNVVKEQAKNNLFTTKVVNNLLEEISEKLKLQADKIDLSDQKPVQAPTEQAVNQNSQKRPYLVSIKIDGNLTEEENEKLAQKVVDLGNVMPFRSNLTISPDDIYNFLLKSYQVLISPQKELQQADLVSRFQQLSVAAVASYNSWKLFINSLPPQLNAQTLVEEVPYDRSRRPFANLEARLNGTTPAKKAVGFLLPMVNLAEQGLLALKRSPGISNILGDHLDNNLREAQSFADSLRPYV